MSLLDYILTIIIISLVCNGLHYLYSEGQLLGWVLNPFKDLPELLDEAQEKLYNYRLIQDKANTKLWKRRAALLSFAYYLLKPILFCVACFASVYGVTVFYLLHGVSIEQIPNIIICCVGAVPVNIIVFRLRDV